ncbi:DNA gyrase/topoisomerase IV subunit A [Candidatus Karelsulcia muelleri]|uniref:DNA topoisomerase (ATP-hydrolyzing) n=1 Tax=Candidatus Karelsulcia muelleri PSPU TaxID=1189303 RepID=A0AAD1EX79_9FLAO|nr:DNA topoisomerase (ATP-hydrolyzing) [Candidatus Karelsulcia muelleri]NJJ98789.1 DNA topoisomerase 4 subunit A [Candidatus Karelsulcia muelleri]BAO66190.1 DNA gyrase A subunit [Candidatus Karelsulcia muelleri PSPU]
MKEKEKIITINIEDEMKSSYIDYSMSVIVSRALPDVRDGLKPVHRRVLYGMYEQGARFSKNYRKSARIVGNVLGKYHPHGDSSVYDAIVRMAQSWSLRYILIDGQGNFGSIDKDPPAAMRYTEIKLKNISEDMLLDIEKETVDMKLNFDDSCKEPLVLPTCIPNLLINGSSGIAVGMATNMPPHNIVESIEAICSYIDKQKISIEELMKYIKAPDFPTGGIIYGYEGVKKYFLTGRGKIFLRSKVHFEEKNNRICLIVDEIPYKINKEELINKTLKLVKEGKLEGLSHIRDESDRNGMRIVYNIKQNVDKQRLLKNLFKETSLETSFNVNNLALVNGKPTILNLKDLIKHFVNHRHDVIIRRTKYDLNKAKNRAHIIEGFYIVLKNLETVIELIKSSKDRNDAKKKILIKYNLSEIQVQSILELKLNSLTKLENKKIKEEYIHIRKKISFFKKIISNKLLQKKIIKKELNIVKKKYGDLRRTEINYLGLENEVYNNKFVITITKTGYIKKNNLNKYKIKNIGGIENLFTYKCKKNNLEKIIIAKNYQDILFFSENGKYFLLKVFKIPEVLKKSKGQAIQNLLKINKKEKICSSILIEKNKDKKYLNKNSVILITKNGIIKKQTLIQYYKKKKKLIKIINKDYLIDAKLTSEILIASKSGKIIKFDESTITNIPLKSKSVTLSKNDDKIIDIICLNDLKKIYILGVSEKVFVKISNLRYKSICKGLKKINVTHKTVFLVAIKNVINKNDIIIINKYGLTFRIPVSKFFLRGRIKLKYYDKITYVAKVEYDNSLNILITER